MGEIVLNGYVKEGHRIASGFNPDTTLQLNNTIALQKPFFEKAGIPNISKMYNGTINLDISPKEFKIIKPDYKITCEWVEGVVETFWFAEVLINFKGKLYQGYIYYPCPSDIKSHDDTIVELIADKVSDLNYGDQLSISVSDEKIQVTKVAD